MKLSEYPRPPEDSGRGLHGSPHQGNHGVHMWDVWAKRFTEAGIKWHLTTSAADQETIASSKRLINLGIMPVIRYIDKLSPSGGNGLKGPMRKSIEDCLKLGVPYFLRINEPDSAKAEWEPTVHPKDWGDIAARAIMEDAFEIQRMGGIPLVTVFEVGDYPPADSVFDLFEKYGLKDLIPGGMGFSIHNYSKGRPIGWPNNYKRMFPDPWTEEEYRNQKQPGWWGDNDHFKEMWGRRTLEELNRLQAEQADPNVSVIQDRTCFRMFDFVNAEMKSRGYDPDTYFIMGTEGGVEVDDRIDPWMPNPTAIVAGEMNMDLYRFTQGNYEIDLYNPDGSSYKYKCPDNYFCTMHWLAGGDAYGEASQWNQGAYWSGWHDKKYDLQGVLPVMTMLAAEPVHVRPDSLNGSALWQAQTASYRESSLSSITHTEEISYLVRREGKDQQGQDIWVPATFAIDQPNIPAGTEYWRLHSVLLQSKYSKIPDHELTPEAMYFIAEENGQPLEGIRFKVKFWDNEGLSEPSKPIAENGGKSSWQYWGHPLGTYSVSVEHDSLPSDTIHGLGAGGEEPGSGNTAFLCIWEKSTMGEAQPSPEQPPSTGGVGGDTEPGDENEITGNGTVQSDVSPPAPGGVTQELEWPPKPIQQGDAMTWFQDVNQRSNAYYDKNHKPLDLASSVVARLRPAYPSWHFTVPEVIPYPRDQLSEGDVYAAVIGYYILGKENNGMHNAYFDFLDENGQRIKTSIPWGWSGISKEEWKSLRPLKMDKPANEPGANVEAYWGMTIQAPFIFGGQESPKISLDRYGNIPCDIITGLNSRYPDDVGGEGGNWQAHWSMYATWRIKVWMKPTKPMPSPVGSIESPDVETEGVEVPSRAWWTDSEKVVMTVDLGGGE